MPPIKAITISQPYASLIADGKKIVENRTWQTHYIGPIAIHAGKGTQYLTRKELTAYPTGAVIAIARIIASIPRELIRNLANKEIHCNTKINRTEITWKILDEHEHTEGPYCWVLDDIQKLDKPIPCSGQQGIWVFDDSDYLANLR